MAAQAPGNTNALVVVFMAAVLLFGLADAVINPGGEYPPALYAWFNIALDAAMTALLTVLVVAVGKGGGRMAPAVQLAGVIGILAGLGQLGIRVMSDHGWWTGHLNP